MWKKKIEITLLKKILPKVVVFKLFPRQHCVLIELVKFLAQKKIF